MVVPFSESADRSTVRPDVEKRDRPVAAGPSQDSSRARPLRRLVELPHQIHHHGPDQLGIDFCNCVIAYWVGATTV